MMNQETVRCLLPVETNCFFKGRRCELEMAEVRKPHGDTVKRTRDCPDLNQAAGPFAFPLIPSPAPRRCEATGRGPVSGSLSYLWFLRYSRSLVLLCT